jgi:hypothetical protein
MKGLLEIQAENAEIDKRIADKRKASLRRLKQRIARIIAWDAPGVRRQVNEAIDAWAEREARR